MINLNAAQRRALKARAHHLQPVVMVGDAGLTPTVLREIDINLKSHELIKIRVLGDDRSVRAGLIDAICTQLEAAAVQHIGKILVIFRPRPDDAPAPKNPAAAAGKRNTGTPARRLRSRNAPRRTKRSYQS
jgi:putative YhbY family RNA-binding protein